jgi:YHS domain-containing protein
MPTTIDQPRVEFEIRTPICPTCGCSLARLGVRREDAAHGRHEGNDYLFCCEGCRETFATDAERYLAQIRDVVVCPACLAEKPSAVMVAVEYRGTTIHFCGCPGCVNAFRSDPEGVLARLEI